ncbi:MAG: hypothetical protein HKO67_10595 [Flavobacteriaceae bacterium]|nr:hypothetical protein [Flavobacteriaceae bacterium]
MNCTHDDAPELVAECEDEIGESTDELLVQRFTTAPVFDGLIDDVWADTRPLVNRATVLAAGDRIIALNPESDGDTSIEPIDLMDPYTGESYEYSLRGGHDGEYLYLLFEWQDDNDSQDRQSWYFDPVTSKWRGENKYANHENDKFYEDKFGMMFPIGNPEGFAGGTCTVTCHTNLQDPQPGQKTSRHYMMNPNELTDLWHWKRVRNALSQSVDDGYVQYEEDEGFASANGRKADEGLAIYSGNKFVDPVTDLAGPKYVIPGRENYYWIAQSEIDNGTAKAVTGVAADGVLTYDGGTIDPTGDPDYSQGFGNKRMPSVIINPGGAGNDGRSETQVRAVHTGSGWQLEIKRKLNTGDPNDAVFTLGEEIPFALAIFNNAAIGHGQSSFLKMKFEN